MRFSIITPAYNMERWITETIESVLSQEGDFEIEYIVIDDGSKDSTAKIVHEYKKRIDEGTYPIKCAKVSMQYELQQNAGAIVAMNNGFALATGEISTWIDADNVFEPGAFAKIKGAFDAFPDARWIKGITSTIDESSTVIRPGTCKMYRQDWLALGIYGQEAYFVEADSVFFKLSLWKEAGPIPSHFKSAGDYWLWMEFAKRARLWSLDVPISRFRKREGQLSKGISRYKAEQKIARPHRSATAWKVRLFFSPHSRFAYRYPALEKLFLWAYPVLFGEGGEYISLKNGGYEKKSMRSYRVIK